MAYTKPEITVNNGMRMSSSAMSANRHAESSATSIPRAAVAPIT